MIGRLTNAIGFFWRGVSPCSKEMSLSLPKRIPLPITPDVELTRIPLSPRRRIEQLSIQHTYSHFNPQHSFAPLGLTSTMPERVISNAFPPITSSSYPLYIQRRRLSTIPPEEAEASPPNHWTRRIDRFKNKFNDFRRSKAFKPSVFLVSLALFTLAVQKKKEYDRSVETSMGERPKVDTDSIENLLKNFNETEQQIKDTFDEIGKLRRVGGLSPRHPGTLNIIKAKRHLLELLKCPDDAIRQDALNSLVILLKKSMNPNEIPADYAWLLEDIGNLLTNTGQNQASPLFLINLMTLYTLLLEKIVFGQGQILAKYSLNAKQKLKIQKHTEGFFEKLPGNFEFQYQVNKAMALTHLLRVDSQTLTQMTEHINDAIEAYKNLAGILLLLNTDIRSLNCLIWWGAINDVINNEGLAKHVLKIKQSISNFIGLNMEAASAFLLQPHYLMPKPSESIVQIQIKYISEHCSPGQTDWTILCRYIEILAEITLSSFAYDVKKHAFDVMTQFITQNTPDQVLYKITITLLNLKKDPCFEKSVEESLKSIEKLVTARGQAQLVGYNLDPIDDYRLEPFGSTNTYQFKQQNLGLFISYDKNQLKKIVDYYDTLNKKIHSHFPIADQLTRHLSVLRDQRIVPRDEIQETIFDSFHQMNPDYTKKTLASVLYGEHQIGKTFEAASFVQKYFRDYTVVKWINADAIDWQEIETDLGICPQSDFKDKQREFKKYFEQHQGWLLVIDNITKTNYENLSDMIPEKGGHILMTGEALLMTDGAMNQGKKHIPNIRIQNILVNDLSLGAATAFLLEQVRGISKERAETLALKYRYNIANLQIIANELNTNPNLDDASIQQKIEESDAKRITQIWGKKINSLTPTGKQLLDCLSLLMPRYISKPIITELSNKFTLDDNDTNILFSLLNDHNTHYSIDTGLSHFLRNDLNSSDKIKHLKDINSTLAKTIENSLNEQNPNMLFHLLSQCENLMDLIELNQMNFEIIELLNYNYIILALSLFRHYYTQENLTDVLSSTQEKIISQMGIKQKSDTPFELIKDIYKSLKSQSRVYTHFQIVNAINIASNTALDNESIIKINKLNQAIASMSNIEFGMKSLATLLKLEPASEWDVKIELDPKVSKILHSTVKLKNYSSVKKAFKRISFYIKIAEILNRHKTKQNEAQKLYEAAWQIYQKQNNQDDFQHFFTILKIANELSLIYKNKSDTRLNTMTQAAEEIKKRIGPNAI